MYHAEEAAGRFVVARSQTAKLFGETEKALDLVAVAVQIAVNQARDQPALFAGNHGRGP